MWTNFSTIFAFVVVDLITFLPFLRPRLKRKLSGTEPGSEPQQEEATGDGDMCELIVLDLWILIGTSYMHREHLYVSSVRILIHL